MACMVVDVAAAGPDAVHARIAGRFARSEPRARVREYLAGLVAGLDRKNGWTLAERGDVITQSAARAIAFDLVLGRPAFECSIPGWPSGWRR